MNQRTFKLERWLNCNNYMIHNSAFDNSSGPLTKCLFFFNHMTSKIFDCAPQVVFFTCDDESFIDEK